MSRNNAGLSTQRIVEEALRIIDGQGLRRLTMRRLGDALEVEAMAVYHHFPLGKEQLFDAVVEYVTDAAGPDPEVEDAHDDWDTVTDKSDESAANDPNDPNDEAEVIAAQPPCPWDERIARWAHNYRARLLRHSGALPLLINRRPDTPSALNTREDHLAAFHEAGLRGTAIADAAATLDSYVLGSAVSQVRAESPHGTADPTTLEVLYRRAGGDTDFDSRFVAGLNALLWGLTGVRVTA